MISTKMGPEKPLPYNSDIFGDPELYVDSLLNFISTSDLLRTFCGGVHILDFFTADPDLYSRVLPQEWRDFFAQYDQIMDLLDLFMWEDLEEVQVSETWRNGLKLPESLLEYLEAVRKHLLDRSVSSSQCSRNRTQKKLARHVAVGMTVKKVHEVGLFASYINDLASSIQSSGNGISHLVDFGSGQNYLGRALASEPYNRNIVAIESKPHNAERAKEYDVLARLAEKERVMRNKKDFRAGVPNPEPTPAPPETRTRDDAAKQNGHCEIQNKGSVQYVAHRISNGDLSEVMANISDSKEPNGIMVMSLHSCGNLVHHGLRSLILNPSVKAVAMVGCCYNLVTERLRPATYKLPELRPTAHLYPRLRSNKFGGSDYQDCDPNGFPMSDRLCNLDGGEGVRLNITARMMAVQAPQNWGRKDSESFFTRHFYRALLQRVFLDKGVVGAPSTDCVGGSPAGHSSGGTPITIGSLRKGCYESFVAYVRGALEKLQSSDEQLSPLIKEKMEGMTDIEIAAYEESFRRRKKDLSIIWSLMAYSAGVVEACIVVDRWLWLREQSEVKECWVESVFEYGLSPRNLVVVGIKK